MHFSHTKLSSLHEATPAAVGPSVAKSQWLIQRCHSDYFSNEASHVMVVTHTQSLRRCLVSDTDSRICNNYWCAPRRMGGSPPGLDNPRRMECPASKTQFSPIHKVELKYISWKTALLLAVTSAKRMSDIQAFTIKQPFLQFKSDSVLLRPILNLYRRTLQTFT